MRERVQRKARAEVGYIIYNKYRDNPIAGIDVIVEIRSVRPKWDKVGSRI